MSSAEWQGFNWLQAHFSRLHRPHAAGVLERFELIMWEDNREGVLAGLDRRGVPMADTVRQHTPEGHWVSYKLPDGRPARYYQAGLSGSRPEDGYGPPLAPHGDLSRVVANYVTGVVTDDQAHGDYTVMGRWEDVDWLPYHFRGEGRLPVRDLGGLRRTGFRRAADTVDAWAEQLARGGDGDGGGGVSGGAA